MKNEAGAFQTRSKDLKEEEMVNLKLKTS